MKSAVSLASRSRGYALVELTIVAAVLAPILYIVLGTSGVVADSVKTNQRESDVGEALRTTSDRVSKLLRPASIQSLRAPNGAAWTTPLEGTAYAAMRFQIVEKLPSSNEPNLSLPRVLSFVRDPEEIDNDQDDDGDGLVDEGKLFVAGQGSARACIATDIEGFEITKSNRRLTIKIQCAKRDDDRRVHRRQSEETIFLRNN